LSDSFKKRQRHIWSLATIGPAAGQPRLHRPNLHGAILLDCRIIQARVSTGIFPDSLRTSDGV